MPRKLTQKEFLNRVREIHGDTYDLSRVDYKNTKTKVEVVCKIHGSWMTRPDQLFRGQGCFTCGKKQAGLTNTYSFDEAISLARSVHGNKYSYDKESFKGYSRKMLITCLKHGTYSQRLTVHINAGHGCRYCAFEAYSVNRRMSLNDFIRRCTKVHSGRYDYSEVKYFNIYAKVDIICPDHGLFRSRAGNHLNGSCCPECALEEQSARQRKGVDEFINDATSIHGDRYIYLEVEYKTCADKVKIKCKKHGIFRQTPSTHLRGSGCPNCNISRGEEKIKKILNELSITFIPQKTFKGLKHKSFLKCDFFVSTYNIVIEYNGRQHYEPVKAFGGIEGFRKTLIRDTIKRDFFDSKDIDLLEIHYKNTKIKQTILKFIESKKSK